MRKISLLFVLITVALLSSCVDDKESATVEQIRTAKTEWLKAQAEMLQAQGEAQKILAETEKLKAESEAKNEAARIEIERLLAESQAAKTEDEADEFMDYLRAMEDFGKMQNVDICIVADESSKHKLSDAYTNVQMDGLDIPKETENIIKMAFRGKKKSYSDYDEVYQTVMLHVAVPVRDKSGDVSGAVVVSGPMEMQENTVIQYEKYMLICVMVGAFLALLLSFFFSRQLVRPIIRIKEAALVLAAGNYAHKTGIRRKDELGALAESMDIGGSGRISRGLRAEPPGFLLECIA